MGLGNEVDELSRLAGEDPSVIVHGGGVDYPGYPGPMQVRASLVPRPETVRAWERG